MPRIPDDVIERLKKEVPIQPLAEAKGVVFKAHGKDIIGKCPFHNDKTPSFVVTPSKNLWNCLGACHTGGNVIQFVQKTEGIGFRHAAELLLAGKFPVNSGRVVKRTTARRLPPPVSFDAEDEILLGQVVDFYHQNLLGSPGLEYLKKRGIDDPAVLSKFKIGYGDNSLCMRLPRRSRQDGAGIRDQLARIGILREMGQERYRGFVVFPIMDLEGKILDLYGRKINNDQRFAPSVHMNLPRQHKGIWNPEGCQGETVILCEAIIDAMTFYVNGFPNVTATLGAGCFLPDHLSAFKAGSVKRVYIAFDRDEGGDRGAESLAPKLIAEGFEVFRVLFPLGMDANEFANASDPPDKTLAALVNAAEWIGKPSSLLVADPPVSLSEPLANEQSEKEAAKVEEGGTTGEKAPEPEGAAKKENAPAVKKAAEAIPTEITEREVIMTLGDREYRVRNFDKNLAIGVIKVNLRASRGEHFHVDNLDLCQARSRQTYITQAAKELCLDSEVIKTDLGKVFYKLEERQEELIKKALKPEKKKFVMSEPERLAALDMLMDPNLLKRILKDFEDCGIVGEKTNSLACYLAAVSRKFNSPLAILIQSSSSAGKTALMDAVLAFMPEEEKMKYSAMTGQSLFYMDGVDLKHKILAIAEEEGAQKAGYALKLLQSEGVLTIASTGKDPKTGELKTKDYHIEGPVMIFMTTTGIDIDNELLNRCIVLTVDEDRDQTMAIHNRQRQEEMIDGLLNGQDNREITSVHQNAQRLLRPILVANPYADKLTFANDRTRSRRDHKKYLTLIRTVAFLHQYQRPIHTRNHKGAIVQYIEVTLDDIAVANDLAHEILGRTLDELPPQTRKLLFTIEKYVLKKCEEQKIGRSDYRFTRREIREHTGGTLTQTLNHLQRLEAMEYIYPHHGRNGQTFVYELAYNGAGKDGKPFYLGLVDMNTLKNHDSHKNLSGVNQNLSATYQAAITPLSPTYHGAPITIFEARRKVLEGVTDKNPENARLGGNPENQLPSPLPLQSWKANG